jgi:hypothetical protein
MEVWLCYFILKHQAWTRVIHVRREKCVRQMSRCPVRKMPLGRQRNILDFTMKLDVDWIHPTQSGFSARDKTAAFLPPEKFKIFPKKKNPSRPCVRRIVQYSSHGIPELLRRFTAPHNLHPSCQLSAVDFRLGAYIFKNMRGVMHAYSTFILKHLWVRSGEESIVNIAG